MLAAFATTWSLWLAAAIFGVGNAFLYPSLMATTVDRVEEHERARALSAFTMFFEIGTAVGGLALGALAEGVGKRGAFLAGVIATVFGLWVLRTKVAPIDKAPRRPRSSPATFLSSLPWELTSSTLLRNRR